MSHPEKEALDLAVEMFHDAVASFTEDGKLDRRSAVQALDLLNPCIREFGKSESRKQALIGFWRAEAGVADVAAQYHVVMEHGDTGLQVTAKKLIALLNKNGAEDVVVLIKALIKRATVKDPARQLVADQADARLDDEDAVSEPGNLFDTQDTVEVLRVESVQEEK